MKRSIWAKCWGCNESIFTQEECYYMYCRMGKFNFCKKCYDSILQKSFDIFRPERSKREELKASLRQALQDFHIKMVKEENTVTFKNVKGTLYHSGNWHDCDVCEEIISMRCSEHCGKHSEG